MALQQPEQFSKIQEQHTLNLGLEDQGGVKSSTSTPVNSQEKSQN